MPMGSNPASTYQCVFCVPSGKHLIANIPGEGGDRSGRMNSHCSDPAATKGQHQTPASLMPPLRGGPEGAIPRTRAPAPPPLASRPPSCDGQPTATWGTSVPAPAVQRWTPSSNLFSGGLSEACVAGPHRNLRWLATGGGGLNPMRPGCSAPPPWFIRMGVHAHNSY